MYGIKYAGVIYFADTRKALEQNEDTARVLQIRDFLGNPMNIIEPVDNGVLTTLEKDGYKLRRIV